MLRTNSIEVEQIMQIHPSAEFLIDLPSWAQSAAHRGPVWSHESTDLYLTLLTSGVGEGITAHINDEVDVVLIGVAGTGEGIVNSQAYRLSAGQMLMIPKNAQRSLHCLEEPWSYLSLHRRRRGLWPTFPDRPPQ
jgi:quercetin dioxygenase-like cupin family protein